MAAHGRRPGNPGRIGRRGRELHARIKQAALARGLACYPGWGTVDGIRGDHVVLAPPYIMTPAEVALIVDRLGDAIEDALSSVRC